MLYKPDNFSTKDKNTCLKALTYILYLRPKNKLKKENMLLQLRRIGINEDKFDGSKHACTKETLINNLKGLDNVRAQRFIIREMIILAVSDKEVTDREILDIYEIAEAIGISGEKVGDFFIWAAKGIEWMMEGIQLVEEDL